MNNGMLRDPDNYVSQYQNYLDSKEKASLGQESNSEPTQTKIAARFRKNHTACKLCKLITRREDVTRILNQGLSNKYTSSIDYFFTKDINALLARKRKPFCIRYFDNLTYDTSKEFLKKFFSRCEAKKHIEDIKTFYTKFKDFPRFYDMPFYRIMNSMIRNHRRLEYLRVFKGKRKQEETSQIKQLPSEDEFQLLEMLGESFKQRLSMDQKANGRAKENKLSKAQPDDNSFVQIQKNFKELKSNLKNKPVLDMDNPFSSDYFHYYTTVENIYPLYSRSDSENAIHSLADLVDRLQTDNYPKPKLKQNQQFSGKQIHQNKSSGRWNSPTIKNKNKQFANLPTTSVTPHSRRSGGSIILSESAKTLALANKIFSNPNLSRQTQRNLLQESRSKSEKVSASPTRRLKSGWGSSSEKTESRFFGGRERLSNTKSTGRLNNPQSSTNNLRNNSNEITSIANVSTGKKKLLIDVQDININRANLYKTITDKFKSTCNLNVGARLQLPGKDFTPYIDSAIEAIRHTAKVSMSTAKKALLSKRSETVKTGQFAELSSVVLQRQNDENHNQISAGLQHTRSRQNSSTNRLAAKILQVHTQNSPFENTDTGKRECREEVNSNQIIKRVHSEAAAQNPGTYGTENSNPTSDNASKRVFKRVMSCGMQNTTPSKSHMQVLRGGTPQSTSNNIINEILKLIETPESRNEVNQIAKGILFTPHSVKFAPQNKRSKSSHPFFGKINLTTSPKPKLLSNPETLINHRRNCSAESKGTHLQSSAKKATKRELVY